MWHPIPIVNHLQLMTSDMVVHFFFRDDHTNHTEVLKQCLRDLLG